MILLTNILGQVGMSSAAEALGRGDSAVDAIEQGIRIVEADASVRFVGRGGDPNLAGVMECDAAMMDGETRNVGAVGALRGYVHAISVARKVMEELPHVLVVGEGAARFADEIGEAKVEMLTEDAGVRYARVVERFVPEEERGRWPKGALAEACRRCAGAENDKGTTVWLAIDGEERIAAGTSTSGWPYKYPGRLGDSPIAGAGFYADSRYGACGCTHTGEMTIRANSAASVVGAMKRGASVEEACREALEDLRSLTGGYLGPVMVHAIDRRGEPFVISTAREEEVRGYWFWSRETGRIERREPIVVEP